jgi:small GTP-binding protein
MPENFKYDVFLSYSSKDKTAVRELAKRLGHDGLRVWFDEWEIQPGDVIGLRIEQGLGQSRTLVLVMSANAFASEWVTLERHTALFRDPTNAQRRFIPLRLDDAEINDALKQFAYVDWRPRSEVQYQKLLIACRPPTVAADPSSKHALDPLSSKVLEGHTLFVEYVAITANGRRAVSGSADASVRVWNLRSRKSVALKGHTDSAWGVAITPDGQWAASGSSDKTIRVWNVNTADCRVVLRGHTGTVRGVAITPDGRRVVSGSVDGTVRLWNVEIGKCITIFQGHLGTVYSVALSANAQRAISGSHDSTVRVWDVDTGECLSTFKGHTHEVWGVALTADGKRAVSGSSDKTVRLWDVDTGRCLATLEGHTDRVFGVAVTADGNWAVSGSADQTVRLWDLQTGRSLAILRGHEATVYGVAITPDGNRAVSVSGDKTVRTWKLSSYYVPASKDSGAARYTNAKVLLVGDSGVGKSALAIRLTENRFEPATMSTDAMWASQLKLPHQVDSGDIDREIWLWDFAGQADYRLIQQLFMDETSLAVLVFNPQSDNPFEGLGQWDRDLQRAARRSYRKLLVAGRCDRGGLMVTRTSLEQFSKERGFGKIVHGQPRRAFSSFSKKRS